MNVSHKRVNVYREHAVEVHRYSERPSVYRLKLRQLRCGYFLCMAPTPSSHLPIGDMYEVGAESGRYYCLNVPLRDGIDDQSKY